MHARLCRLLCDGFSSPLYGGGADDLRREAGRLRFRVLSGHAVGDDLARALAR